MTTIDLDARSLRSSWGCSQVPTAVCKPGKSLEDPVIKAIACPLPCAKRLMLSRLKNSGQAGLGRMGWAEHFFPPLAGGWDRECPEFLKFGAET